MNLMKREAIMKKTLKYLLIILTLIVFNATITVYSAVETGNAIYSVTNTAESNSLLYGVNHKKDIGVTQRSGVNSNQVVNVLDINPSSNARIFSYANLSNHSWTKTTIADLARQFERENPGWRVLAGTNADFYDINGDGNFPYQTSNAHVSNGEFYKTTTGLTVGFTNDKSKNTLIGGKPTRTANMILAVYDNDNNIVNEFSIEKLNAAPDANQTSVYFGSYNSSKVYVPINVNVGDAHGFVVENAEYALPNNANDFYGKGIISSTNVSTINKGQFAIVTNNSEVAIALREGVKIRAQYQFTGDFANITDTTGSNGQFLENGEYMKGSSSPTSNLFSRHPRTLVGMKLNGSIVLAVVDGRQAPDMAGVYDNEMAAIMKNYGCVKAYNLDGGGSSSMIIRKGDDFVVMNSPSDSYNRPVSNALLVAVPIPDIEINVIQKENSLEFNTTLIDNKGIDIQELVIEFNGIRQTVENGKTEFIDLNSNTTYDYLVKYRDGRGRIHELFIEGQINLKLPPETYATNISETDNEFIIEVLYSGEVYGARIQVNGREFSLVNRQANVPKEDVGLLIDNIDIVYIYDVKIAKQEIGVQNLNYKLTSSIELDVIDLIVSNYEQMIHEIFK